MLHAVNGGGFLISWVQITPPRQKPPATVSPLRQTPLRRNPYFFVFAVLHLLKTIFAVLRPFLVGAGVSRKGFCRRRVVVHSRYPCRERQLRRNDVSIVRSSPARRRIKGIRYSADDDLKGIRLLLLLLTWQWLPNPLLVTAMSGSGVVGSKKLGEMAESCNFPERLLQISDAEDFWCSKL